MEPQEIVRLISNLNEELMENGENEDFCLNYGAWFSYKTDGYINVILFMDIMLWNDDNDEREYDDKLDDYEPLEPFIQKRFNEVVEGINKLTIINHRGDE
jgi:hypothetical protein